MPTVLAIMTKHLFETDIKKIVTLTNIKQRLFHKIRNNGGISDN